MSHSHHLWIQWHPSWSVRNPVASCNLSRVPPPMWRTVIQSPKKWSLRRPTLLNYLLTSKSSLNAFWLIGISTSSWVVKLSTSWSIFIDRISKSLRSSTHLCICLVIRSKLFIIWLEVVFEDCRSFRWPSAEMYPMLAFPNWPSLSTSKSSIC